MANFAAFKQQVQFGVALAATPGSDTPDSRPRRERNRTVRGAMYDEERVQEEAARSKNKGKPRARRNVILDENNDTGAEERHEEEDDPFADEPEIPSPQSLLRIRNTGAFSSVTINSSAAKTTTSRANSTTHSARSEPTAVDNTDTSTNMGGSPKGAPPGAVSPIPAPSQRSAPVQHQYNHPPRVFAHNISNHAEARGRSPTISAGSPSPQPATSLSRSCSRSVPRRDRPTKGNKRARASRDAPRSHSHGRDKSVDPPAKKKKNNTGSATRSRPKGRDLDKATRGVLALAIADYRSLLATQCPFPNETEEQTMAGAALARACVTRSAPAAIQSQDVYDTLIDLITARDSHMRGELKTKLVPLVAAHFGFDPSGPGSHKAIKKNRKLSELLKSENRLAYRDYTERKGLYESSLIQSAINIMWFTDANDEGIVFNEYFRPIPLKTIALILTTIEFIIDRWSTGSYRNSVTFAAKAVKDNYERHLMALEELKARSNDHAAKLTRLQRRWLHKARLSAGVAPVQTNMPLLSADDLDAFVQDDTQGDGDEDSVVTESDDDL